MTATDWCRACRALHDTAGVAVEIGAATLRDRLAALDRLVRAAPFAILANYDAIDEGDLSKAADDRAGEIESGDLGWHAMPVGGPNTLRKMAAEIRAADALLSSVDTRYNRIPPDPATAWRTSDGSAFVIPTRRRRDMGSRDGNDLSYGRRGTLMHRVVPAILAGTPVRPLSLAALDARSDRSGVVLGAALFPGAALTPKPSNEGFLADTFDHADIGAALDRQLAGLAGASALVWPELTLDDDALELLGEALARLSLEREDLPEVVIAGSWHRLHEGAVRNVSPILDGTGGQRDAYSKMALFKSDELGAEDIAPGEEFLVLACDRFLAAVAICKDYCGLGSSPPWHLLDVDLMLIPSMGGATTMDGHLFRAHNDQIEHGSRAFVVQQGIPRIPEDAKGFVLPAPRKVPRNPLDVVSNEEWERHEL